MDSDFISWFLKAGGTLWAGAKIASQLLTLHKQLKELPKKKKKPKGKKRKKKEPHSSKK